MSRAMRDLEQAGVVGLRVLQRDQFGIIPPVSWLVDGLITTGFTVLYGPPECGKSLLALDWALSATTGHSWFGRKVEKRKALYVAAEGASGITRRVEAWESDRHARADDFEVVPHAVNLLQIPAVRSLDEAVEEHNSKLLVVDTLSRSIPGGDENAARDMSLVVQALTNIQADHDCAVILIHHSGIEAMRPRGSTALFGAADTQVRAARVANVVGVHCDKQKDDEAFGSWSLKMKPVKSSIVLTLGGSANVESLSDLRAKALAVFERKLSVGWTELIRTSSKQAVESLVADESIVEIHTSHGAKLIRQGAQQHLQEAW